MEIKIFDRLPADAEMIRQTVFVDEQGFMEEWDAADNDAVHIVLYDVATPVATCRILCSDRNDTVYLGRFAVVRNKRGGGIGSQLISLVTEHLRGRGVNTVILHAQQQAVPFYEKNGFECFGTPDEDEGCPHRWMKKEI
ncbi:MAG: GNAT family N-acetyltransferase [Clostridia bacterium]|nr:GNAT family N-acetyltransferase [Clostridia bacterium]